MTLHMEKHVCKIRQVVVDERANSYARQEIDWDYRVHSDKRLRFHWNALSLIGIV